MKAIFALLLLSSPLAWSRLGDTPAECERQYGKAASTTGELEPGMVAMGYENSRLIISVTYTNGVATSVSYKGKGKPFTEAELKEIFRKESGAGIQWKEVVMQPSADPSIEAFRLNFRRWQSEPEGREAMFHHKTNDITFKMLKPSAQPSKG